MLNNKTQIWLEVSQLPAQAEQCYLKKQPKKTHIINPSQLTINKESQLCS